MKQQKTSNQERTTTITVKASTAELIRKLAGRLQHNTGERVTQGEVVEKALNSYVNGLKEVEK